MADEILTPNLDGVEDDNPETPDEIDSKGAAAAAPETDDDTPDGEEVEGEQPQHPAKPAETKPEGTEVKPPTAAEAAPKTQPGEVTFTPEQQAKLDKILADRLARDRQAREKELEAERTKIRRLEALAGVTADQLAEKLKAGEIERAQMEFAMDEETARKYVETQQRLRELEATEAERRQKAEEAEKGLAFERAKLTFTNDPKADPIFKLALEKYGDEVATFSNNGQDVNFLVALKYVAGEHLPEIVAEIRKEQAAKEQAAEQRAIREATKRAKAAPETATSGAPAGDGLTAEQRVMAAKFGLDTKEVAQTAAMLRKTRNR